MDRKALIIIALCFVGMILINKYAAKKYPPIPVPVQSTNEVRQVEGETNVVDTVTRTDDSERLELPDTDIPDTPTETPAEEVIITLENEDERFHFSSDGGGLQEIELIDYERSPSRGDQNDSGSVTLNTDAPFPIMSLLNEEFQGAYELRRIDRRTVEAVKSFSSGLLIRRTFSISTNYLITATTVFENYSEDITVTLPDLEFVTGTSTTINGNDDMVNLGVMWFNGSDDVEFGNSWFANKFLGCFEGTYRPLYQQQADVVWAAVHNQFFTVLAQPDTPASEIRAVEVEMGMTDKRGRPIKGIQTSLVHPGLELGPQLKTEPIVYEIYTGPKEYSRLKELSNERERVMGFGAFFGIFSKALLAGMNTIHGWGASYGWSIILITIFIKLLFWPLTNASTKSMKRMSKLQPQMKEIQEKYKEDPKKMNMKLMAFMKENKVSPLGGCLPMLLQMPVFIGFFYMIRSAIELRGASFLWAWDLSQADTLFTIAGFPVNPMPILMGVTMFYQAQITPIAPGVDPVQAKMMKYMPMMFVLFLYNFSSGLTLYWTVSNILTIIQTRITRIADEKKSQPEKPVKSDDRPKPVFSGKKKRKKNP